MIARRVSTLEPIRGVTKVKALKMSVGTIGLVCAMICCASSAFAQAAPEITTQTLIDRAKIEDMLTRYMTELGHSTIENYVTFYTDDAELVMGGGKSVKGRAAIFDTYTALRALGACGLLVSRL